MGTESRTRAVVASLVLASGLALARAAAADPLAILVAESPAAHPTAAERQALGDAISTSLAHGSADVLSSSETRSRVEVLDPARLSCDAPACGAQIATLLHARGVVLVTVAVNGPAVRIELVAVDAHGDLLGREHGEATIADWEDAVALGRVVAGRLLPALTGGGSHGGTVVTPPGGIGITPGGARDRSSPRVLEVIAGAGLVVLGGVAAGLGGYGLRGEECVENCPGTANYNDRLLMVTERPSSVNYLWVGLGAAAIVGGVVLIVDGLLARERIAPPPAGHALRTFSPQLGVVPSAGGGLVTFGARF